MIALFAFLLRVFHFIYSAVLTARSFWKRYSGAVPYPLLAPRQRVPKHLGIIFTVAPSVSDKITLDILTESIVDSVSWCRTVGIEKLTVYEENDLLSKCVQSIRERLPVQGQETYASDSETEYPITPPPSDYSESRPLSPSHNQGRTIPVTTIHVVEPIPQKENEKLQRRHQKKKHDNLLQNTLLLCLSSRESSKAAIAAAAQTLAQTQILLSRKKSRPYKGDVFKLSVAELDQILEDEDGLSSPDFIIIHPVESSCSPPTPPELHGFPPWHIRLTEIYQNKPHRSSWQRWLSRQSSQPPLPLDETSFRAALDEFASAEMRFGK